MAAAGAASRAVRAGVAWTPQLTASLSTARSARNPGIDHVSPDEPIGLAPDLEPAVEHLSITWTIECE